MRTKTSLVTTALVGFGLSISAATIEVTTTNPVVAVDGQCSLIEAIDNANVDAVTHVDCLPGSGADVIGLAPSATYVLNEVSALHYGPNGLPIVASNITIEGRNSTIRRAPGSPAFRLLVVNSSGTLFLRDLTLQGGDSGPTYCGGALLNAFGRADLLRTTITESTAPGAGGICNSSGPMTLTDCEVSLNIGSAGIGGISNVAETNDAIMLIERTLITGNQAIGSGAGGIYSVSGGMWTAELHVISSIVSDNIAEFSGGGIRSDDSVVFIGDSTIKDNQTFSAANYSFCGGLGLVGGEVEIRRTTISGNSTQSLADFSGFGGGVCLSDNTTIISNSTISGNEARGAATTGTGSMTGLGGGVMAIGGAFGGAPTVDTVVMIEGSTICDNSADNVGGGISVYRYAGDMAVEVVLRNTIVAENLEQGAAVLGNCVEASPAVINSFDFNLADDITCNLIGTDDLVVADVMLAPLADNVGTTMTHLPLTGSPAIDSGDNAMCPEFDQHGNIRPWDGDANGQVHCDRGAVELGAPFFVDGFETGDTNGWSNSVP